MDLELVDRIYESSFVPELWPGVLDELGRKRREPEGPCLSAKATFNIGPLRERAERIVNEGRFWRGQVIARLFAHRHPGFLTDQTFSLMMNWI